MTRTITIFILILFAGSILAQSGFDYTDKTYMKKADPFNLPHRGGFALSTAKYLKDIEALEKSPTICLQLGDNYRLNGQPVEASIWYGKGIQQVRTPEDYLYYALVLKMTGQCEEGQLWYTRYLEEMGRSAEVLCPVVSKEENPLVVQFNGLAGINTASSEFSAFPWENKLLFTTDRTFSRPGILHDPWTMRGYTEIFTAERNESGQWSKPTQFRELDTRFHDGSAVVAPDAQSLYLTRTQDGGLNEQGMRDLTIWEARRKGNRWKAISRVPFSSPAYATCHPTMDISGKTLYFASDMPGGLGGMDIYKVERLGAIWGVPQNMGPGINSPGNEVFPHISDDGFLFYSSDGLPGFGGLDLFVVSPGEDKALTIGRNLGEAINTSYDDFALTTMTGRRTGYVSTNRPGGAGQDDIYQWVSNKPLGELPYATAELMIVDSETGLSIPGAKVKFGKQLLESNDDGKLKMQSLTPGSHTIEVSASGFISGNYAVTLPNDDDQIIKLERGVYQPFVFKVLDKDSGLPVPNPFLEVFEMTPGGRLVSVSQSAKEEDKSNSALNLFDPSLFPAGAIFVEGDLVQLRDRKAKKPIIGLEAIPKAKPLGSLKEKKPADPDELRAWFKGRYQLRSTTEKGIMDWNDVQVDLITAKFLTDQGFAETATTGDAPDPNLPWMLDERKRYQIRAKAEGYLSSVIALSAPEIKGMAPMANRVIEIEPIILGIEEEDLTEGAKFKLEGIYYDYDAATIRKDAFDNLNELVRLMNKFPNMEIELSSHTDCRGRDEYNEELSQRRAQSAINYLQEKGIDVNRLIAKGYGERQLVNKCDDGVRCKEEEHQMNRRTEFKIVRM
ncbi:MAG: OmpA family protein [Saprospiraceae bacterium]|nr:OmpA family protein [Saprospiraceae bacterium]